jgi:hypothetical protein
MKPRDLEAMIHFRKSRTRGLVVIPPGDPLLFAYKTRYHPAEVVGEDTGLVYVDSRPTATWTLSRNEARVNFLDDTGHTRILKAVDALIRRAGITASVEEASAISGD